MTTEEKALAMVREEDALGLLNFDAAIAALCRAIEQHEAFRQEVSDALRDYYGGGHVPANSRFAQFIIPKPKPDPLLAALLELELSSDLQEGQHDAKWIRNKLDELGFEIREKNDGI